MKNKMSFLLFSIIILLNLSLEAQDSLLYIVIRDAPDGGGREVDQVTMTTDDALTLYAAGYDHSQNFIGDQVAMWSITGDLDQMTEDSTDIFIFSPGTAPTSGSIRAIVGNISHHTETITVDVGAHCYYEIQVPCPPPFDILGGGKAICLPEFEDTTIAYVGDCLGVGGASYDCDGNFRIDKDVPWETVLIDSTNFSSIGTLPTFNLSFNGAGVVHILIINTGQGRYVLNGTDTSGVIIIQEPTGIIENYNLLNYELKQAYPNPFNPTTKIEFILPRPEFVTLKVYNVLGEEITTLVSNYLHAGNHTYEFDGRRLASGVYLYKIETKEFQQIGKVVLMK